MEIYLDMGNNYIYNLKNPGNNDQAVNKGYVDTNTIAPNIRNDWDARGRKIFNLNQDFSNNVDVIDTKYLRSVTPFGTQDHHQNFDCKQKVIFKKYN